MEGIQYVTDGAGKRIAVMIDLERYGADLEDFFDALAILEAEAAQTRPPRPYAEFRAGTVKAGKLG